MNRGRLETAGRPEKLVVMGSTNRGLEIRVTSKQKRFPLCYKYVAIADVGLPIIARFIWRPILKQRNQQEEERDRDKERSQ